ncbi:MAG TPA: methyl-accepting chemotaxis protein [Nitrososphaerales archaeon]|nr:methyl-accepting chemotaxis protein [Nitrososphaerales archaeon]
MRRKIGVLSLILILLTVVAIYFGSASIAVINHDSAVRFQVTQVAEAYGLENSAFRAYLLSGQQQFLTSLNNRSALFQSQLSLAMAITTDDAQVTGLLSSIGSTEGRWHQEIVDPMLALRQNVTAGQMTLDQLSAKFGSSYGPQLTNDVDNNATEAQLLTSQRADQTAALASGVLLTVGAVEVGVGIFLTIIVSRSIVRPVKRLQDTAAVLSGGDLTPEIQATSRDEIGQLADSFKRMTEGLRSLVDRVIGTSSEVSSTSQQLASSTEQINSAAQQVSSTIQQIAKGAQTQAQRLDEANKIIERLNSTMKGLTTKAQSASDLSTAVGKVSESAAQSATDAAGTLSAITRITGESAEKVRSLAAKSGQIASVLDVIRKVADQTNLLALNAAIEAARAGEAGRGFAVVAEEVKRLAEQVRGQAAEIASQIKQIQEDAQNTVQSIEGGAKEVSEGKDVINKALLAIEDIGKKVQEVAANGREVSTSILAQLSAVEQLAKAVSDTAAVAEENASATEEVASASEEQAAGLEEITSGAQNLANLAEQLQESVSTFKLPESAIHHEKKEVKHTSVLKHGAKVEK